ncbi:MAG: hypothetical protein KBC96_15400 [Armatimonadetes bacterium]|nr:hypothetical protein [Armatimonadota bacterium]
MRINTRALSVFAVSLVATLSVVSVVVAGTSFAGQGTISFDSIKVGQEGVGGVTYFNGSIINNTKNAKGADNPVTLADNVRIDGKVYRGATQGPADSQPFIIDDNGQVTGSLAVSGSLSAGSITGLSNMVSAAGFAQTSAFGDYAKLSDLSPYAKTSDLSAYAQTSTLADYATLTDLGAYASASDLSALSSTVGTLVNNTNVLYNYNRCVLNLGQSGTYWSEPRGLDKLTRIE